MGPLLYLRGPPWDCMPCVLRPICICAWAPSGCVRWVAVAAVVVVTGRALPCFSSLGGCRTRRCWNRCWRYALRGNAFSSRCSRPLPSSSPPACALLLGWGAVGPRHAALAVAVGAQRSLASTSGLRHRPQQVCETAVLLVAALFVLLTVAVCRVLHPLVVAHASVMGAQRSIAWVSVPEPWPQQVGETAVLLPLPSVPARLMLCDVCCTLCARVAAVSHFRRSLIQADTAHSVPPGPPPPPAKHVLRFSPCALLWCGTRAAPWSAAGVQWSHSSICAACLT
jgi:hypothetical protein